MKSNAATDQWAYSRALIVHFKEVGDFMHGVATRIEEEGLDPEQMRDYIRRSHQFLKQAEYMTSKIEEAIAEQAKELEHRILT